MQHEASRGVKVCSVVRTVKVPCSLLCCLWFSPLFCPRAEVPSFYFIRFWVFWAPSASLVNLCRLQHRGVTWPTIFPESSSNMVFVPWSSSTSSNKTPSWQCSSLTPLPLQSYGLAAIWNLLAVFSIPTPQTSFHRLRRHRCFLYCRKELTVCHHSLKCNYDIFACLLSLGKTCGQIQAPLSVFLSVYLLPALASKTQVIMNTVLFNLSSLCSLLSGPGFLLLLCSQLLW